MSEINTEWYDEYLRTQFIRDLRRYGLQDLQSADLDDLKQILAEYYCDEIRNKHHYVKANDLQAYFSTILRRRMCKWAIKRTKESKTMRIDDDITAPLRESGHINLDHPVYRNMNKKQLAFVILFYHCDLTASDIAGVCNTTAKAVYHVLDRAKEIMMDNVSACV